MEIKDWQSCPTQSKLYKELKDLDLLENIAELDVFGFTIIPPEKVASKETLKKVSTGGAKGSSEPPSRKIFRRADIINLMKTDIKRYQSMEPEIRQAYAEGRVR